MKRILALLTLAVFLTDIHAQELSALAGKAASSAAINTPATAIDDARHAVLSEDFDKALYIYSDIIGQQKTNRAQGNQVNNELLAEYAYVLALTGAQEAALINIDLALNLKWPSPAIYYFTGNILEITGFDDLSAPYIQAGRQPSWMQGQGSRLNSLYRTPVLLDVGKNEQVITRISHCLADSRNIEALCYATALTRTSPDMPSAWLLQSAVFEKLGCYTYALYSYEKGLAASADTNRPGMADQLAYLKKKSLKNGNRLSVWQISAMVYGGLSYSNGNTYINGRYGVCSGPVSFSANMSFSIPEHGDFSYYAGLSMFYNIGKLFSGLGMGLQSSGSHTTFNLSPTVGLSFINARRTSSFDISIAWNIPCRSGVKSTLGISIGKTFYFNANGKSK